MTNLRENRGAGSSGNRKRRSLSQEDLKRSVLAGSTVTLATVGCSGCNDNGAVDPPPPPLICGDVQAGQALHPTASLSNSVVTVLIENSSVGSWTGIPTIGDLEGLTLLDVQMSEEGNVIIQLGLASDTTSTGRFTMSGELEGGNGVTCTVTRRFTVTLEGQTVDVAEAAVSLPLENRNRAKIELVRKDGLRVLLRPASALPEWKLAWSVTEGSLEQSAEGVLWTLPSRPGFYQAELLTDHGDKGFGVDTLAMEVS